MKCEKIGKPRCPECDELENIEYLTMIEGEVVEDKTYFQRYMFPEKAFILIFRCKDCCSIFGVDLLGD